MTAATMTQPVIRRFVYLLGPDLGQAGPEHGDDQDPEKRADDRAPPAHETGAPDDHGGDHLQLEAGGRVRIGRGHAGRLDHGGHRRQQAREDKDRQFVRARVDAGQADRLFVRADGDQVAAEHRARQDQLAGDDHGQRQDETAGTGPGPPSR